MWSNCTHNFGLALLLTGHDCQSLTLPWTRFVYFSDLWVFKELGERVSFSRHEQFCQMNHTKICLLVNQIHVIKCFIRHSVYWHKLTVNKKEESKFNFPCKNKLIISLQVTLFVLFHQVYDNWLNNILPLAGILGLLQLNQGLSRSKQRCSLGAMDDLSSPLVCPLLTWEVWQCANFVLFQPPSFPIGIFNLARLQHFCAGCWKQKGCIRPQNCILSLNWP